MKELELEMSSPPKDTSMRHSLEDSRGRSPTEKRQAYKQALKVAQAREEAE